MSLNNGNISFTVPSLPPLPVDFQIGLIVGPSGSGKSTLLRTTFGPPAVVPWEEGKAVVSHFESIEDAIERLGAVGLNNTRAWLQPYHTLSTGEQFRADLARAVGSNVSLDEFTSTVNREAARAGSCALGRFIRERGFKSVVIATCHADVEPWLLVCTTHICRSCDA